MKLSVARRGSGGKCGAGAKGLGSSVRTGRRAVPTLKGISEYYGKLKELRRTSFEEKQRQISSARKNLFGYACGMPGEENWVKPLEGRRMLKWYWPSKFLLPEARLSQYFQMQVLQPAQGAGLYARTSLFPSLLLHPSISLSLFDPSLSICLRRPLSASTSLALHLSACLSRDKIHARVGYLSVCMYVHVDAEMHVCVHICVYMEMHVYISIYTDTWRRGRGGSGRSSVFY